MRRECSDLRVANAGAQATILGLDAILDFERGQRVAAAQRCLDLERKPEEEVATLQKQIEGAVAPGPETMAWIRGMLDEDRRAQRPRKSISLAKLRFTATNAARVVALQAEQRCAPLFPAGEPPVEE
jgi:hypothetical protein